MRSGIPSFEDKPYAKRYPLGQGHIRRCIRDRQCPLGKT